MTNEGGKTCSVCTEEMDLTDLQLKPCKCGYEICVWCWHHIMNMAEKDGTEGRCPACRTPYDKEKIVSMSVSCDINSEKKSKPQKMKSRTTDGRKHLSNVRVVQRHLVYTMGIPATLADEDVLQRKEYFGQYGKVLKASLTRTSGGAIQYSTSNTCSVYITYTKEEEAIRCIQSVHGYILQGQPLRACFGTTKYCHTWLRNMPCSNPDCVYLHEIGSQEDSFTKDEIVSAYTRSRVQQITGATNNLERRSGDVLPPPVDEFSISGTASSKPISRSPSDNPSSQLKCSPPNSSSGRSISLPAAASWGLRASNGHPPTATSPCSNGSSKQTDCNGSVGFPSLVGSTSPSSTLPTDVGKKSWVTEESRSSQSSKDLGSSDYSKQYVVKDRQKITADTLGQVQDAPLTATTSRHLPTESRDDNCTQNLPNIACGVDDDQQSCLSHSDIDDDVALDEKIPSLCSGLSSVGIDGHHSNERYDATEPNSSVSNHLFRSFRNHESQQSNPENTGRHLTSLQSREVTSDGVFGSRLSSNWGSESQIQVLRDRCSTLEVDSLASGEQNTKVSEVHHPVHLAHRSSSINISSSSNGHSWPYVHACGTSDQVSRDPLSVHTKTDEVVIPFTSSDSVMPNGYAENNVSTCAGLEELFGQSNLFSSVEKGKYSGRLDNDPVNFERNASVDMGESNIISNILSMDFDTMDESLVSPQNFAKLFSESDNQFGSFKIRSSRKDQKSNESRFSFARQVDYADQRTDSDLYRNIGNTMASNLNTRVSQDNQDIRLDELPNGLSCNFLEESDTFYSGNSNISSNRFSVSRAPVSAPPGFSVPSKVPPPGFSVQERMDRTFDATTVNQFFGSSSLLRNQYHVQPTSEVASIEDIELFDPAILAVGTGRPANGINNLSIDIRSNPALQLGGSDIDPRNQLLRQQFLSPQQNLRYPDHIGDRFSPQTSAYNTPSRYLDQSQFAQLSYQPRTDFASHGWNSWNENQSGNDLNMLDLLKNERFGHNQYFPEYDNRNSRMPKPNDLYNKAFGM
ncbi:Ccr4-not transcription complex subunit [Thalictrum thalictroides]|uniref:Ccr4-not transcription complex subunit n=1 Tax=Thalictrum thalictroides TaxID=46969 RepID=A0A7J6XHQ1_THATH|nr:Ccr4-not transcription complex subunit [Thalictrum thalictroides]